MIQVLVHGFGEDHDIFETHQTGTPLISNQYEVECALKSGRCVRQAKRKLGPFLKYLVGDECSFVY